MKNILIGLFTLTCSMVFSQFSPHFGAKAGLNYGFVDGGDRTIESNIGFFLGATAYVDITEVFSVQSELIYSKYNIEYYWEDGSQDNYYRIDREFNSSSILLPILANYEVVEKFKIYAGPQLDFNLNTSFDVNRFTSIDGEETNIGISGDADDIDVVSLDIVVGTGYTFKRKYFVDLRYVYGFNKIVDLDDAPHKSLLQFGIGYNFN